jgi:hypothetical protein
MSQQLIDQISRFSSYRYDPSNGRIINLKEGQSSDVDAFLELQYILDSHQIQYRFEKNFQIRIIGQ